MSEETETVSTDNSTMKGWKKEGQLEKEGAVRREATLPGKGQTRWTELERCRGVSLLYRREEMKDEEKCNKSIG